MTTPEFDTASLGTAVLAGLAGQECSFVRESYGEQLVVGFGRMFVGEWPLRITPQAAWVLHSRYGTWQLVDGANVVASDEQPLDDRSLHRVRSLLLYQHVSAVDVDSLSRGIELVFENGAALRLERSDEALHDESIWAVVSPGGLVIEGTPNQIAVSKFDDDAARTASEAAWMHNLVREVAQIAGLAIFEPPTTWSDSKIDAILTAPDGTVLLVEFKFHVDPRQLGIRTVSARDETTPVMVNEIPLGDVTPASVAEQVRQLLQAA